MTFTTPIQAPAHPMPVRMRAKAPTDEEGATPVKKVPPAASIAAAEMQNLGPILSIMNPHGSCIAAYA